MAHGYLRSSFIPPLTNQRDDAYGGSLENRMRFPLEIFHALRVVWPAHKPIAVRISAHEWVGKQGVTPEQAAEIAALLQVAGVDICDVSIRSRLKRWWWFQVSCHALCLIYCAAQADIYDLIS